MTTITERIADEERRHAEKAEEIKQEAALVPLLPIEPEYIHFASKREPWISYKVENIAEALPIIEAYTPSLGGATEDGCLYVGPQKHERGKVRWVAAELLEATIQRGRGFSTNELNFWSMLPDGRTARIKIELKAWPWKASPQCSIRYDQHGDVTSAKHDLPFLGEWQRVKWGSGSPDCCRFSLYFDGKAAFIAWLNGLTAKEQVA